MGLLHPCSSFSDPSVTRCESPFLRRILSRPWPPSFRQPSPTVKRKTFGLPPDHGQRLTSSSLTDDSEDFHCEHFAVQIHLVGHHLSHTPNFERQSRVSGITFRTHMHGSHKVHGELFDRYETNDHTKQAPLLRFLPTLLCLHLRPPA